MPARIVAEEHVNFLVVVGNFGRDGWQSVMFGHVDQHDREKTSSRINEKLDGVLMTATESNIGDLARAKILWKSLDALRGQMDAIRDIEGNFNSRSHLTPDSRTFSAVTEMNESPEWR